MEDIDEMPTTPEGSNNGEDSEEGDKEKEEEEKKIEGDDIEDMENEILFGQAGDNNELSDEVSIKTESDAE